MPKHAASIGKSNVKLPVISVTRMEPSLNLPSWRVLWMRQTFAAAIASRRTFYETRAAYFHTNTMPDYPATRTWRSENSTAWTVVYESDPRFQKMLQGLGITRGLGPF